MARFLGFGDKLLIDVDSLNQLRYEPEENTVYLGYQDGTESNYKCDPEQWRRLRGCLVRIGLVVEV